MSNRKDESEWSDSEMDLIEQYRNEVLQLEEEIDCLKCQLAAANTNIAATLFEHAEELRFKNYLLTVTNNELQDSNRRVHELQMRDAHNQEQLNELRAFVSRFNRRVEGSDRNDAGDSNYTSNDLSVESSIITSNNEVRLLAIISVFLKAHPGGANIYYICSYLRDQVDPAVADDDVLNLMRRFPILFREELSGVGANLERRWKYVGIDDRSVN